MVPAETLARGVCAYYSGNHAQALALAAALLGTRATIRMPEDSPSSTGTQSSHPTITRTSPPVKVPRHWNFSTRPGPSTRSGTARRWRSDGRQRDRRHVAEPAIKMVRIEPEAGDDHRRSLAAR